MSTDEHENTQHEMEEENARILNICTRSPAALSILCSGYIVYSVITDHQKRSSPTQRIVLGMSCADIICSLSMFLGSWPLPHNDSDENAFYGAIGNTQTCTMQGFFLQLGLMAPLYNGFLALYCFLFVSRDWGKRQMKQVEVYGHIFVLVFALSLAIAYIPLELYNPHGIFCWVESFPHDCTQSFESIDGITNCERGDNAHIYEFFVYGTILWINIFLTCFCMVKVYCHIRNQEIKMEAYTSQYSTTRGTKRGGGASSDSRDVAIRGALFTGAFLVTYLPPTIAHIVEFNGTHSFAAEVVSAVLLPSQGIFNFLVYVIHPQVKRHFQGEKGKKTRVESTMPMSQESKCEQNVNQRHESVADKKEETN